MIELKPCHSCEFSASIQKEPPSLTGDWFHVRCDSCLACGASEQSEAAAAEAWNRRPAEDALRTALEQEREKTRWIPVTERLPVIPEGATHFLSYPVALSDDTTSFGVFEATLWDTGYGDAYGTLGLPHVVAWFDVPTYAATPTDGEGESKSS